MFSVVIFYTLPTSTFKISLKIISQSIFFTFCKDSFDLNQPFGDDFYRSWGKINLRLLHNNNIFNEPSLICLVNITILWFLSIKFFCSFKYFKFLNLKLNMNVKRNLAFKIDRHTLKYLLPSKLPTSCQILFYI